jgi:hypothetical protein
VTQDERSTPSIEGVEEWLELVEQALEGLHHALNNRIGSLSALVELRQMGDATADSARLEGMAADLKRLEEANRAIGLLTRGDPVDEPLIVDDVLADVFAVHRFIHDVRDLQVTIVPTRYVEPVRVQRWALVRVLVLLLKDAKRLAKQSGAVVRAATESDEQTVRVEFRVGSPLVAEVPVAPTRYAESVAATFGGTISRRAGVAELRLPSLKARRAADRQ